MRNVVMRPRCINCHSNDNIPKQAEDNHPHYFGKSPGANNLDFQATKCVTFHQTENNTYSGISREPLPFPLEKFKAAVKEGIENCAFVQVD